MNKMQKIAVEAKEKRIDPDMFGKLMDKAIDESEIMMIVHKDKHEKMWEVKSSHGCGSVMDFYVLLNALKPIFVQMYEDMQRDIDTKLLAKSLCEILEAELIKSVNSIKDT